MSRKWFNKRGERITVDVRKTGDRIKSIAKEKGIKVNDIVEILGLAADQSVYKWYRGESLPTMSHFLTLSNYLEVGIEDLLVVEREEVDIF